jgi:chaperone required for assembly of F1-ATPase
MNRFYREVGLGMGEGGSLVLLDGKPVRTPGRRPLVLPARGLAAAVADEWQAQAETIRPDTMRLTRLATTVIDLMPLRREDAIAEAAGYGATDLVCYRATEPAELVAREAAAWDPWLDWLRRRYDASLAVAAGIDPLEQPPATLGRLRQAVAAVDDWRLVGLHAAVTTMGSLVLGLAMAAGELAAEPAFEIAFLEELYEIERWGLDPEQARRHERLRADLAAAERFLLTLGRRA